MERISEFRGEIEISYILKSLRVLRGLARQGLTKAQWEEAFAKYSTKLVWKPPPPPQVDQDAF